MGTQRNGDLGPLSQRTEVQNHALCTAKMLKLEAFEMGWGGLHFRTLERAEERFCSP